MSILDECISLGAMRTMTAARQAKEVMLAQPQVGDTLYPQNSPSREKALDPLFQVSIVIFLAL